VIEELHEHLQRRLEDAPGLPPEAILDDDSGTESNDEKIRLAYISNRFEFGDQARMVEPLLQLHNRRQFHVTVYQQSHGSDSTTQRLRASADNLRYVGNLDDEHLAVIIAGDQIDILVDLCTDDANNRATVLHMHPAKIQVGAWGAGMGIGMPGIDYVLADDITGEAAKAELYEGQKLHKLDFGLLSYQPRKTLPPVGALPLEKFGAPTIGVSCNAGAIQSIRPCRPR
jgi:predicted O-linked N-acetylglucosamine transferase (SPINDLY family)